MTTGADINDNVYESYLLRPISSRITPFFIWAGFTPNGVTLISFMVGCLSAVGFINGHIVIAGLLYLLSFILDLCDGEVARITNNVSEKGIWLDTISDQAKDGLVLWAMAPAVGSIGLSFAAFMALTQHNLSGNMRKLVASDKINTKRSWKTAMLPSGAQRALLVPIACVTGQLWVLLALFIIHYNLSWVRLVVKRW